MKDLCEDATFNIDANIIPNPITYNIYPSNSPLEFVLDEVYVTFTPYSSLCPQIELDIPLAHTVATDPYAFDQATNTFEIDTEDLSTVTTLFP